MCVGVFHSVVVSKHDEVGGFWDIYLVLASIAGVGPRFSSK